ncbi:unnamed protein product [Closterium sp. Yama58-4]|nr:unnamed protein product [Closterium sp. Yama58-4]
MIVSGGFKRKGSATWWGDDSSAEAPTMQQPRKKQCLVGGDGVGFKRPVNGTTVSVSPTVGGQASAPLSSWARLAPISAVGSATVGTAGSAALSRPPGAATEGATLLDPLSTLSAASREAARPADSAEPAQRDQVDGNGLGFERPPIPRKSAAEKLRRHRISAGFKRLGKVLPPSWMRQNQKHKLNMASRTDMASLLDSAVDFIRELEDRKAQLAQAYIQQVSRVQQ